MYENIEQRIQQCNNICKLLQSYAMYYDCYHNTVLNLCSRSRIQIRFQHNHKMLKGPWPQSNSLAQFL